MGRCVERDRVEAMRERETLVERVTVLRFSLVYVLLDFVGT